ncbi:M20/M25/M40 family metallo-hydrolase [Archangium violaceum]|nr:M20/M25/M40 family metallo-hydrolase [Archangium violaceum]
MSGHVVMYGHYDVASAPTGGHGWMSPPRVLTEADGRWFALGVADNKGPLAARLVALAGLARTPALTWFIQGEEETGSAAASRVFEGRFPELEADLWLEETGYHDHEDGTLRLIARRIAPEPGCSAPPDVAMGRLLEDLRELAGCWGIGSRLEVRGLNKGAVEGGCPFNRNLPVGARYLALGINDSFSRIHASNESVPLWTFPLHAEELQVAFHWVDQMARGMS